MLLLRFSLVWLLIFQLVALPLFSLSFDVCMVNVSSLIFSGIQLLWLFRCRCSSSLPKPLTFQRTTTLAELCMPVCLRTDDWAGVLWLITELYFWYACFLSSDSLQFLLCIGCVPSSICQSVQLKIICTIQYDLRFLLRQSLLSCSIVASWQSNYEVDNNLRFR